MTKPKLFFSILPENNAVRLQLENVKLPAEGIEIVIVTTKEMKTVIAHDGDEVNILMNRPEING